MNGTLHHAAIALAQTTGFSREERQAVLDLLRGITTRGGAVDDLHAAVLARLGARDFGWPEFDRWQAFFAARWKFPPLWDELKKTPTLRAAPEIRHAYQEQKLYLLLHWLQSLETTRAQARTALARYARRGIRGEIARQGDGTPCPVCDPLNHREVKDNHGDLPPFHPGCRCLLLAIAVSGDSPPGKTGHSPSGIAGTGRKNGQR
ncbi:MAG: hypothetical protein HY725_02130 [Candidatus Rokubacteria bacterium]|nr:hypothetical protein [Candidatus Rokubacteria bacterium]